MVLVLLVKQKKVEYIMKIAVYPGSFDPITLGHLDIIKRAANIVDELHVVVADNVKKSITFSTAERIEMLEAILNEYPNIKVSSTSDLVVRYAKSIGATLMVRGLRNIQDYENEYALYQFNRELDKNIETIVLFPSSRNQIVSSSAIKELVYHDADISAYVPQELLSTITNRLKKNFSKK